MDFDEHIERMDKSLKEKLIGEMAELTKLVERLDIEVKNTSSPIERINSESLMEAIRELQRFFSKFGQTAAVIIKANGEWKVILVGRGNQPEDALLDTSLLTDAEFTKFLKSSGIAPIKE